MRKTSSILQNVRKKIKFHRKSTLWNHLITILRLDSDYSGITEKNHFKIWRYNYWLGVFYPIYTGKISKEKEQACIIIRTRMNPIGIIFLFIIMVFWGYGIYHGIFHQINDSLEFIWRRLILGIILFILPIVAIYLGYNYEKKQEIMEIQKWR